MKSDVTTTVLTFALFLLAVCGVFCAILTFTYTHELRSLSTQAGVDKDLFMRVQVLANEVSAYNQKTPSPKLTEILQAAQSKPPGH